MARPKTLQARDPDVTFEEAQEAYDFEEHVLGVLESEGIPMPRRPVDEEGRTSEVPLPGNLAAQADDALGDLLGQLSTLIGYLEGRYRYFDAKLKTAKRKLKVQFAVVKKEKEGSPSERTDDTLIDGRIVEEDARVSELEEIVSLTKAALDAKEQDYSAVSRIITLREKGNRRGNRTRGVGLPGRGRLRS